MLNIKIIVIMAFEWKQILKICKTWAWCVNDNTGSALDLPQAKFEMGDLERLFAIQILVS